MLEHGLVIYYHSGTAEDIKTSSLEEAEELRDQIELEMCRTLKRSLVWKNRLISMANIRELMVYMTKTWSE